MYFGDLYIHVVIAWDYMYFVDLYSRQLKTTARAFWRLGEGWHLHVHVCTVHASVYKCRLTT
jgi:hypothetical protein